MIQCSPVYFVRVCVSICNPPLCNRSVEYYSLTWYPARFPPLPPTFRSRPLPPQAADTCFRATVLGRLIFHSRGRPPSKSPAFSSQLDGTRREAAPPCAHDGGGPHPYSRLLEAAAANSRFVGRGRLSTTRGSCRPSPTSATSTVDHLLPSLFPVDHPLLSDMAAAVARPTCDLPAGAQAA